MINKTIRYEKLLENYGNPFFPAWFVKDMVLKKKSLLEKKSNLEYKAFFDGKKNIKHSYMNMDSALVSREKQTKELLL